MLWDAANILRGPVDASDFKAYVFPLLFLTPNFVPRNLLSPPMKFAATYNPVTYLMEALRSLILDDLAWAKIGRGFGGVEFVLQDHFGKGTGIEASDGGHG